MTRQAGSYKYLLSTATSKGKASPGKGKAPSGFECQHEKTPQCHAWAHHQTMILSETKSRVLHSQFFPSKIKIHSQPLVSDAFVRNLLADFLRHHQKLIGAGHLIPLYDFQKRCGQLLLIY